ncbi:MAG: VCBS repeat-containing protein, partial [FCB group bacterium]|nr:VCBS repeat-containing protein [FCB group bacterium]
MRKILLVVIIIAMTVTAYAADGYFMPDEIGVCEHPWGAILGDLPPVVLDDTTGWPQNPGWPQQLPTHPNFSPSRGTAIADIDGDGLLDIVASSNNQIYVFDYEGDILDGWPVTVINTAQGAPSVGDVDNDGEMEIVQGTRGTTSGGRLYMFNADGTVADGFPLNFSNQNPAASPTLYDLDDDGYLEIIIGTRDYPIGQLRVVRYNGSDYGGDWPIALDHVPTGSAAVGDVDNDGEPEIAYMSYNSIYLLNSDGTSLEGYPWTCSWGNFSYQSIALADINDDDYLELICANHGSSPAAFVLDYEGNTLTGWPHYFQRWTYSPPSVCDLDSDGDLEIIIGTAGSFSSPSDNLYAFHDNGDIVSGFPVTIQGSAEGPTAIGDLEGNGDNYIAFDNNIVRPSDGLGNIYICDESGYIDDPYPLMPYGFTYMNGIQVGDLNRNGVMELVSISAYEGIANASVWSQR